MAHVYVARISQPMIVQHTFTKYQRLSGKIDVKSLFKFPKKGKRKTTSELFIFHILIINQMISPIHLCMHYDCFILFSCSLQGNGLCDRRTRPCRKVTVLGTGFIPSENMTCHLEEVRVRVYNELKKGK